MPRFNFHFSNSHIWASLWQS